MCVCVWLCTCWYKHQAIHNARYVHKIIEICLYIWTQMFVLNRIVICYVTSITKCVNCVQTSVKIIGNKNCQDSDINCAVFMKLTVVVLSIGLVPLPAEVHYYMFSVS